MRSSDPAPCSARLHEPERVLLIDPDGGTRTAVAERLTSLGYLVETASDGLEGAAAALRTPPHVVIADLWLPGVSGVQLCRLLQAEPATAGIPVLLRGDADDRRNRFWAERAGAFAFLGKGRIGELVRALRRAVASAPPRDDFFLQIDETARIFDRIARHLDAALFESVIASEVRALASSTSAANLFDLLSQFLSQIHPYRWLALSSPHSEFVGLHHHAGQGAVATEEVRVALKDPALLPQILEDEDAIEGDGTASIVERISFGGRELGTIALAPLVAKEKEARQLLRVVAGELGGALRMTALVDETKRLASTDSLTRLMNRRAFVEWSDRELARLRRYGGELGLGLLDVDHFKSVNDRFGHGAGDAVLRSLGLTLSQILRKSDVLARWGGEEFVFALPSIGEEGTRHAAERVRAGIEAALIAIPGHEGLVVTASIGVAQWRKDDDLHAVVERADAAMYLAKRSGRNRVVSSEECARAQQGRSVA